ncbi:MAG TPA: alpha/beta hydrolase [Candidatus Moranbacteria bacterium]|nr:alpha/beta hydrolase [Candidatus Moranbacteria bacterium]
MEKKINKKLLIVIVFFLSFIPVSLSQLLLNDHSEAATTKKISGYEEWTDNKKIEENIIIEEGATLVIKKGVTVTFKEGYNLYVEGKMLAKGTKTDPIKFRKEGLEEMPPEELWNYNGYLINISGEANFINVDISGGGNIYEVYLKGNELVKKAYANDSYGVIYATDNAKLKMSDCNIHGNVGGIHLLRAHGENIKVYKTLFDSNNIFDVRNSQSTGYKSPDFRYNWWRRPEGPEKTGSIYKYISGTIESSEWLTSEEFHDPVIIIPGILGSQKKDGAWQIDPIFHTYDNLYQEFANNGYVPEKDLFEFPYEWRDSNIENAKMLKTKINEIKTKAKWPEVDIVAHSMGGLLAREYIESDYYQDDVSQLVTLGAPHLGAPEAYLKWDGDGWFWSPSDIYTKRILNQEAEEGGYADIFDYIHNRPIKSLEELLPVYNYLQDVRNDYIFKEYPTGYPKNDFLENLNGEKKEKLNSLEFDKIIGRLENENITISGFKVINADMGKYWEHGYPLGFEIPIGDRGMLYSDGDKTVPLISSISEEIIADYFLEIKSDHRNLPTEAQKDILEILTGKRPTTESRDSLIKDIFIATVFSPIDIQIIAPDGKRVGKNFETGGEYDEIPNAYCSGYNTENEFLTIPNPKDGEYKILTQGTGEGDYKIKVAKISEGEIGGEATELTAEVSGTASTDQEEEKILTLDDNEIIVGAKDTTPPVIEGKISPEANANGWHNQNVTVHFEATDESGIQSVSPDIVLENEGENQEATGTAVDMAGNSASVTMKAINIDKTIPISDIQFSGTKGENDWFKSDVDINLTATDNLSGIDKILYSLNGSDYAEGINFSVSSEGENVIKYYALDKAGNKEEEKEAKVKIDKKLPSIKIISPKNKNYLNNKITPIKYEEEDNLTAQDNLKTEIFLDGKLWEKEFIDFSLEHLGNHQLLIKIKDEAGNIGESSLEFNVKTDVHSIISNVRHYFFEKLITSRSAKSYLEIKLRVIEDELDILHIFETKWMPQWAKKEVVKNLERHINQKIDELIKDLENMKILLKSVDPKARELLIESLENIKI